MMSFTAMLLLWVGDDDWGSIWTPMQHETPIDYYTASRED